jgi:hypothetical protein
MISEPVAFAGGAIEPRAMSASPGDVLDRRALRRMVPFTANTTHA